MKKLLAIGIVLLSFYGCSEPKNEQEQPTTGNIVGTVFNKNTGEPRAGVKVSIGWTFISVSGAIASYVTGSDGLYSFENVPIRDIQSNHSINTVWVYEGNAMRASQGISVVAGKTATADISY